MYLRTLDNTSCLICWILFVQGRRFMCVEIIHCKNDFSHIWIHDFNEIFYLLNTFSIKSHQIFITPPSFLFSRNTFLCLKNPFMNFCLHISSSAIIYPLLYTLEYNDIIPTLYIPFLLSTSLTPKIQNTLKDFE